MLVDREVLAVSPKAQSRIAILPLRPAKYSACKLRIQVNAFVVAMVDQLHCIS